MAIMMTAGFKIKQKYVGSFQSIIVPTTIHGNDTNSIFGVHFIALRQLKLSWQPLVF